MNIPHPFDLALAGILLAVGCVAAAFAIFVMLAAMALSPVFGLFGIVRSRLSDGNS